MIHLSNFKTGVSGTLKFYSHVGIAEKIQGHGTSAIPISLETILNKPDTYKLYIYERPSYVNTRWINFVWVFNTITNQRHFAMRCALIYAEENLSPYHLEKYK